MYCKETDPGMVGNECDSGYEPRQATWKTRVDERIILKCTIKKQTVEWWEMNVTQVMNQQKAVMNTVMNLRVQ